MHVIDAFTGKAHPNGQVILNKISGALARYGAPAPAGARRFDATGNVGRVGLIDQWRVDSDREWVANECRVRKDSRGTAGGGPRDFEHIYRRVWEEQRKLLNGMTGFPMDSEVPLGAKNHTARREFGQGRAEYYQGGSEYPTVRGSMIEETFGVAHIVAAVEVNRYEALSESYAGRNQLVNDLRLARRVIDERINDCIFNGFESMKLYGFMNYPSMPKYVESTKFDGTATGAAVLAALQRIADFAYNASGGRFQPDKMAVSNRVYRYIAQTKLDSTSDSTTILQFFLAGQDKVNGIKSVVAWNECQGTGPGGKDAVLVWRDSPEALHFELIQAPTPLPAFRATPFDDHIVIDACVGGMVMGDMQQCVAFVDAG